MARGQRLVLLGVAAVIAVVAFVLIRPGGGEQQPDGTGSSRQPSSASGAREENDRTQRPAPQPPTLRLRDGKPAGGVEEITVKTGERAQFAVASDQRTETRPRL